MVHCPRPFPIPLLAATILLALSIAPLFARAGGTTMGGTTIGDTTIGDALGEANRPLEAISRTGVLYDRVLPLARLDRLDGSPAAPVMNRARWRQAYDELRRASVARAGDPGRSRRAAVSLPPDLATLDAEVRSATRAGVIPLAILDRAFEQVRPSAIEDGSLRIVDGRIEPGDRSPLVESRAFAAAALAPRTYRGANLEFSLDARHYVADAESAPRSIAIDFADGRGFRPVRLGERVNVRYTSTGRRLLTARITRADGSAAESRFAFEVAGLATPSPQDTLPITAAVAWQGLFGTGEAYVFLAPGRTQIENPVIVVEGFDLDNEMNWDELYALLNQQNLLETLRADGFDAVVLNFTDATDAIQKNGLVVAELIQQVQAGIAPQANLAVVGASMGGLCSRYALAWLESNAIPHRVRTWLSFDAPHSGAVIPLGLQHWVNFFSGQSADAGDFLVLLNRPAARQMLIHHYATPPATSAQADPLRTAMLADFAALGDYPSLSRRVAIANGSGNGANQGFAPAAQVIRWDYTSLFLDLRGNVWALPNLVSDTIFAGRIRIVFSPTTQTTLVSGAQPWDGAPGGSRSSFADVDSVAAPGGDILALHPNHCFIPTVSALALATGDPFFNVAGAPDPLALSPFDAIYFPAVNESHVFISPQSAVWIRDEVGQGVVSVPSAGAFPQRGELELAIGPNPFSGSLSIVFALGEAGQVDLGIFALDGREVRRLVGANLAAGPHRVRWDGRDGLGNDVPAGIYFARLTAGSKSAVGRAALVR